MAEAMGNMTTSQDMSYRTLDIAQNAKGAEVTFEDMSQMKLNSIDVQCD